MGETTEFTTEAGTGSGYLAPASGGEGPGLVVIQEWWGVADHIKDVCDRFAAQGFTALAPDLYHGKVATTVEEAQALVAGLEPDQVFADLVGAVRHLRTDHDVALSKVGAVGYCLGGGLALAMAAAAPIDAAVAYYGLPSDPGFDPAGVQVPVLGHFAGLDEFYPPDAVRGVFDRLRELGKPAELNLYDGVNHAFFNDTRPEVYDRPAAARSWDRTLAFLREQLGRQG